jgi:hypothetical protein
VPEFRGNINAVTKARTVPRSIELTPQALGEMCLGYLAENPPQLAEFMGLTGYSPNGLRKVAGTPELDSGLIDYFASNEPLLLALCANNNLKPDDFMRVWARLNPSG